MNYEESSVGTSSGRPLFRTPDIASPIIGRIRQVHGIPLPGHAAVSSARGLGPRSWSVRG